MFVIGDADFVQIHHFLLYQRCFSDESSRLRHCKKLPLVRCEVSVQRHWAFITIGDDVSVVGHVAIVVRNWRPSAQLLCHVFHDCAELLRLRSLDTLC